MECAGDGIPMETDLFGQLVSTNDFDSHLSVISVDSCLISGS
ncbi:hypothetical protein SAMN02745166_02861 [Prosthecobacter debontii]|uniref:Uncharacterized protein n=1 Tax=Prosthecobacter debontii TaxID=48467 RepID=A0A1T4YBI5_9BACT|nr:hypothetical protein SAMN02745166_02861 [Prosthecobacter debontii]